MTPDQISSALAELIAVTTGWTEEAYEVYEKALGELEEPVALAKGIDELVRTWTRPTRPPLAVIIEAYRKHKAPEPLALPRYDDVMDPKQGIPLAEQNYRAECRLHGRKPDMEFFRASMAKALARDVTPRYNEVREPYIDGEPRRS